VILFTLENLVHLENVKIILMDGTIKFAPSKFKQLYTLVVFLMLCIFRFFLLMLKK
jgi:hypothetical protein